MDRAWPPTRDDVVLHRDRAPEVPGRPRRWSLRRYLGAYDTDPVVVWVRYVDGGLARYRVAGPLSTIGLLSGLQPYDDVVITWDADATDRPPEDLS